MNSSMRKLRRPRLQLIASTRAVLSLHWIHFGDHQDSTMTSNVIDNLDPKQLFMVFQVEELQDFHGRRSNTSRKPISRHLSMEVTEAGNTDGLESVERNMKVPLYCMRGNNGYPLDF